MSKLSTFVRSFSKTNPVTATNGKDSKPSDADPYSLNLKEFGFSDGIFISPPFMMDLLSTKSVLEGKAYPIIPYIDRPGTIVDCGGNAGATACYLSKFYPNSTIFSFEPSLSVFEFHKKNTAQFKNIKGFGFGLGDRDQSVDLYSGLESTVTQSVFANSYTGENREAIEIRDARKFFESKNIKKIDLLKIDTQGAEVPILRALSEFIADISVVYVEYHSEDDRLAIDRILSPSHIVVSGRIDVPHIGELCYVNKRRYWDRGDLGHYKITSS